MGQRNHSDYRHWIALGSGVGATVLLLLLLFAPSGPWKAALLFLIGVTLIVMVWNPRYRLFGVGTVAALTGLGGSVAELSLNASATLLDDRMSSGSIEGGSEVPPVFFLMLLVIGVPTIAFNNVGRGWIWAFVQ